MEDCDFVSINDQLVSLGLDLTFEAAVSGIILEHVDLKRPEGTEFNFKLIYQIRSTFENGSC